MENKGFGAIPSPKDERDFPLAMSRRATIGELPDHFECVRQRVLDQGHISSCVGHAFASAVESMMYVDRGYAIPMSAGSIYQNRNADHWQGEGMYPRNACEILLKKGIVPEREYSYNEPYTKADKHQLSTSPRFRIQRYLGLNSLEEIKRFLYQSKSYALLTMYVYHGDLYLHEDGSLIYHGAWGVGSSYTHEVCVIGYDDRKGLLTLQNSWGTAWGDGGFFYMPYDVFPAFYVEAQGLEASYEQSLIHEIGTARAEYKGQPVELPFPSYLAGEGHTMYPLRSLNETFGYKVEWSPARPNLCTITARIQEE